MFLVTMDYHHHHHLTITIYTFSFLLSCMASSTLGATTIFNVLSYGAVGNGRTDDSQAFVKAWNAACQYQAKSSIPVVYAPAKKTFLLDPLTFKGPCKSSRIYMLVSGNIVAPVKTAWSGKQVEGWMIFTNVNGLVLKGKAVFDARGASWWPSKPCFDDPAHGVVCKGPPGMIFRRCNGLRLDGFWKMNGPGTHVLIMSSNDVVASNLRVIAPGDSPNTDGINISGSTKVQIRNSFIATGDDCIAVSAGSSNIDITGITCGPGHGISIGSLGRGGFDVVENVRVRNSTLKKTLTGVRIKTIQGGKGYARKISFEGIKFEAVDNPIQIEQFYCPLQNNCQNFEFMAYFVMVVLVVIELMIVEGEYINALSSPQETTFDVLEFGAVGDGKTDDSKAFESTWAAACQKVGDNVKISIPYGNTFLVSPLEFRGPCKCHNITFQIGGSIVAQPKKEWKNSTKGEWLKFEGVDGLTLLGNGQGLVDGQGDSWWQFADNARPAAMRFVDCKNLEIMGLRHVNSQKFHVSISGCNNATISNLHMIAPQNSPNTDGIDVAYSSNITILNCTIQTGDDCIAIKGGTSNVNISGIACGPGHGISIGSLGENGKHDQVEAININNCTFNGTQNGVRIKTWQGGFGFARNINFSNIIFTMSGNPVVIDQFYCPHKICSNKTSAVEVRDVRYSGLTGTSASKNETISFRCSDVVPCSNIVVDGVDIKSSDETKSAVYSVCLNAHGIAHNVTTPPLNCLQK